MLSPVVKRKNWYWKREDWSHTLGLNGTWIHLFHEYIKSYLNVIREKYDGKLAYHSRPGLSRIIMFYRICREYNLKLYIPLDYKGASPTIGRVELYDEMQETGIVEFVPAETLDAETYPYFPVRNVFSPAYADAIHTVSAEVENLPDNLDNLIIPGNGLLVNAILSGLARYAKHPKHIVVYALDYRDHNLTEYAKSLGMEENIFIYYLDRMNLDRFQSMPDPELMVYLDTILEKKAFIMFNERYNPEMEKNNCFWIAENLGHLQYLVSWREFDPILYGTDADLEAAEKAYLDNPEKEGVPYGNPGSVCNGSSGVSESIDVGNDGN